MAVTGDKTMSGTGMMVYWASGTAVTYIDRLNVKIEHEYQDIDLPRKKITQYKHKRTKITGTIGAFEYSQYLQRVLLSGTNFRGQNRLDILAELEDGESGERFSYSIQNIKLQTGDLANWQVGETVKKEYSFVATGAKIKNGDNR
ncbi:phage tail tube protein [Exiguobacterium sp.]|uniref:phage tail tube protein n=1 Tax=Exiguobacterium sp. TaxID=44751 RepID=UPI0028998E45|nr:phage tail tube protein [Exiguobacterium sp.]